MSDPGYNPHFRTLDAAHIVATIDRLRLRIEERFPDAGLSRVARELGEVAGETQVRVGLIERKNVWLRLAVGLIVAGSIWVLYQIAPYLDLSKTSADSVYTLLQGVEAAMNILVLIGAALAFLYTVEVRLKRKRALMALHELRSIVHVIDMHQLTKDPSVAGSGGLLPTPHSPKRDLSTAELARYLDYCSELLALTAKVAALYAQSLPDPVVVDAVSDLERTTSNLSQKIWQKLVILNAKGRAPG
jgi:hypothetical protein